MTMNTLLVKILERRYKALLSEYASLQNGDAEQDRVAEEMDRVDFELFQLKTSGVVAESPTQEDNWGNEALEDLHSDTLFFQGKFDEFLETTGNRPRFH